MKRALLLAVVLGIVLLVPALGQTHANCSLDPNNTVVGAVNGALGSNGSVHCHSGHTSSSHSATGAQINTPAGPIFVIVCGNSNDDPPNHGLVGANAGQGTFPSGAAPSSQCKPLLHP